MTYPNIVKDTMVIDHSLQMEIIRRVIEGNFGDQPAQAINALGTVQIPGGRDVAAHLRHAVDAILIDTHGNIVLITREHNPGAGLLALPGGFIDPLKGVDGRSVVEKALVAVLREAAEETGISEQLLANAQVLPIGGRSYDRSFDIRYVWRDMPGTEIKEGDFVAVSTQGFCAVTTEDLSKIPLKAGDDATKVHVLKIVDLVPGQFGILDHLPMIKAAMASACTSEAGAATNPQRSTMKVALKAQPTTLHVDGSK